MGTLRSAAKFRITQEKNRSNIWLRSGASSATFAHEICEARRKGVHLLLVHEFPSVVDTDPHRNACAFNDFWNDVKEIN